MNVKNVCFDCQEKDRQIAELREALKVYQQEITRDRLKGLSLKPYEYDPPEQEDKP